MQDWPVMNIVSAGLMFDVFPESLNDKAENRQNSIDCEKELEFARERAG
jgi:hypothetical protein